MSYLIRKKIQIGNYVINEEGIMNMNQEINSLSDFVKIKELGKGAQGTVFLMEHKDTKQLVACKIIMITDSEGFMKQLQNEITALIKIVDSKYLIKFYGAFFGNNILAGFKSL